MTVWTSVSLEEANEWLKERAFNKAIAIHPIEDGVEDSVFRLDFADGSSACLRLFERTEALGPVMIARKLADCGLPTCPPIEDSSNRILVPLKGKPACLFPWIEGTWVAWPSNKQIAEIGRFMGRMAKDGTARCADWERPNPRGWPWFEDTAARVCAILEHDLQQELLEEMDEHRDFWKSGAGADVPRGPVHADLFRNNVMFKPDGSLGAVIDWGFCASEEPLLYDLAIVANDWCLKEGGYMLDQEKLNILLKAREEILPLTKAEKEAWPMALRLAALRFYLSRLVDYHWPRNPNGKALDPDHFGNILRTRKAL
ncbi:MAG: homoserine kinase [Alphaproteobacteria bacterium]|nr:homoserine kinase [Alphaproteobacteria bacterium]